MLKLVEMYFLGGGGGGGGGLVAGVGMRIIYQFMFLEPTDNIVDA